MQPPTADSPENSNRETVTTAADPTDLDYLRDQLADAELHATTAQAEAQSQLTTLEEQLAALTAERDQHAAAAQQAQAARPEAVRGRLLAEHAGQVVPDLIT